MLKTNHLSPEQLDALRGTDPLDESFWWQTRDCPGCRAEALDALLLGLLLRKKPRRTRGPHLDDATVAGLIDGSLPFSQLPAVFHHLSQCDACLAEVGELRIALAESEHAARAQRLALDDEHLERAADALLGESAPRRLGRLKLTQTAAGLAARFIPLVRMRAADTLAKLGRAYRDTLAEATLQREFASFMPKLNDKVAAYREHLRREADEPGDVFFTETSQLAAEGSRQARVGEAGPHEVAEPRPAELDVGHLHLRISAAGSPSEPHLQIQVTERKLDYPAPGVYLNLEANQKVVASAETDKEGACTLPLPGNATRLRIETEQGTWTIDL